MIPKIQLALDCSNTEEAIRACQGGVVDEVDIIETGYCLIAQEGARVVKLFREMYPEKPLVADLKIVDAGAKIAGMLLEGRPDYTTILCACEKGTITGVRDEVEKRGLKTELQMELYGHWSFDDIPMWLESGIKQLTLQHSGDLPGTWTPDEIAVLKKLTEYDVKVCAAGAIGYNELELFRGIPVDTFIFGRGIRGAADPAAEARRIKEKIREIWG
ncbi:MAG: orotidine 5'-phosphate decarboxylase [Erysipelotrichaceae bacterium]|nr:orotidine 5'-phosphate decarboxylase [Erysipelotrichaceae bacterium]